MTNALFTASLGMISGGTLFFIVLAIVGLIIWGTSGID